MENIPSTMVLHKRVDGVDIMLSTMAELLVNNRLVKLLGVIIRGTYQAVDDDIRWEYEQASNLWSYVYPDIKSSYYGSSDKAIKYQENPDYQ